MGLKNRRLAVVGEVGEHVLVSIGSDRHREPGHLFPALTVLEPGQCVFPVICRSPVGHQYQDRPVGTRRDTFPVFEQLAGNIKRRPHRGSTIGSEPVDDRDRMRSDQRQVLLGRLTAERDQAHLDLCTKPPFLGKACDHVAKGYVQCVDLPVLGHAPADIGEHDHRQRPGLGNSEGFELRQGLRGRLRTV